MFCSVKEGGVAWHFILCFPLVTESWFMGSYVAGTCFEFWEFCRWLQGILIKRFRRGTLLFPFWKICHLPYESDKYPNIKGTADSFCVYFRMLTARIQTMQFIRPHVLTQGSKLCHLDSFDHSCHFKCWNNDMTNSWSSMFLSPFNNKDVLCLVCLPFLISKDRLTQTNYSAIYTDISLTQHWTGQQGALGQKWRYSPLRRLTSSSSGGLWS